ncbi:MAG: class II glutamine amidotransferase [Candidatus Dormibacteria bacterium]
MAVWPQPQAFARVLPWALDLERVGVAGFGWGVAWREEGVVRCRRDPGRLSVNGAAQEQLAQVTSSHFLVHLRRPSRLSTTALADTQPFVDEAASFAFAHNGRLEGAEAVRSRFPGKLQGHADSEVGFRLFEARRAQGLSEFDALTKVHQELGGSANLALLPARGPTLVYAGNEGNDFWCFGLEGAWVASTALHSADEALFSLCFPKAERRVQVGRRQLAEVGEQRSRRGAAPVAAAS